MHDYLTVGERSKEVISLLWNDSHNTLHCSLGVSPISIFQQINAEKKGLFKCNPLNRESFVLWLCKKASNKPFQRQIFSNALKKSLFSDILDYLNMSLD